MNKESLRFDNSYPKETLNKPKFLCFIRIGQHSVNIFSEFEEFLPYFESRNTEYVNDIPGWQIGYSPIESSPSLIYLPNKETQFDYKQEIRTLIVKGTPRDFQDGQALAYISFWLTEGDRQRNSSFTIHAATLAINNKGILLIGDRGSGKTSAALGLLQRYNGELIANDLSIIRYDKENELVLLEEGSKVVRLRLASIKTRFPHLLSLFPDQNQSPWTTKIRLKPDTLGIKIANGSKPLVGAFTIHLDSNMEESLTINRMSGIEIQFELYENLSRIIRGSAISVFGADKNILGYMPSLESQLTHKNKVDLINHLVKERGIWHVSGGKLDEICNAIFDLVQKQS